MNPGHPLLLKCPFCGNEKEVLTLLSGNTFQGQQWSDCRRKFPMLPEVSSIQKCPSCGMYYFTDEVERRQATEGYSFETGELTYEELREAAGQFGGTLSLEEWHILEVLLVWAYNDKYNREDMETTEAPKEEQEYINSVLDNLIVLSQTDVTKAEYLRERGRFEDALAILNKCHQEGDFFVSLVKKMKSYAKAHSKIAFKIEL